MGKESEEGPAVKAGTTGTRAGLAIAALAALWLALGALPARAAEWETYLSDSFNGPDSMFYTGQAGEAYYSLDNGRYLIDGMNTGVDSLSALTDNLYYYYVEAQCELLDSTAGELAFSGVVFHYNKKVQGKLSYYVFYAYGDGYYGAKRVIGDQVEIVLPLARSEMLDPGRPNILAVDCQGTRFDLYINGRYVDGFTDVRVDGGGCGFYVSKFSKAAFDNFMVKVEHRGGGVVPPDAPVAVESGAPNAPGAGGPDQVPPGLQPSEEQPGLTETGHSFIGYSAPVIPKNPDRPVYPWEVGVDKSRKGKKNNNAAAGEDAAGKETDTGEGAEPERAAASPKAPPGGHPAPGAQHPASQSAGHPAGSNAKPAGKPATPPVPAGDLPHASIRDAGEPGAPGQGPVALPEGEELMPETAGPPPEHHTPVGENAGAPSGTPPAGPGHPSEDVQLVPAEEADGLLQDAAATSPDASAAEVQPSAIGNEAPARAASSVVKRVRPDAAAPQYRPKPVQPQPAAPEPEEATPAEPAPAAAEPETPPAVQPETQPELKPVEPVKPAKPAKKQGKQSKRDPQREAESKAEPAPASGGSDLSLFGGGEAQPEESAPAADSKPPASTQPEDNPAVPEPAPVEAAPANDPESISLGKIDPQYGKLGDSGATGADTAPSEPAAQPAPVLEDAAPAPASLAPASPAPETPAPAAAPSTTGAPQPSAYFSGPGAVQITDDFSKQIWPVSEAGPCTYRYFGAAYEVDNLKADTMAISFQEHTLADCELSVGAEFLDGASYVGYGVAARFNVGSGGVSYYGLFISRSGEFLLLKVVDGAETVLKDWTASTLINPSQANKVTLEVIGARLTAYINGTAIASVQDTSLAHGGYALLAGPGVKVRYDNLLLRGYPAK
jgi:hypothetical protein